MRKQIISLATLASAGIVGYAGPTKAALQLSAVVSGTSFSCVDQAACDNNPVVGFLGLGTVAAPLVINGVSVFGSLHIAQGIPGNPGPNLLTSSSLQVANLSGAARDIEVAVGATSFSGPASSFATTGSGTWVNTAGSNIALGYFIDAANAQGADTPGDTPGVSVTPFNDVAVGALDSFSHSGSGPINLGAPYSMTLHFAFDLAPGGQLISRGQAIATSIPEPITLAIFGTGLLGLAFATRTSRART